MHDRRRAARCKYGLDIPPRRQVGLDQRPQWEEMPMREIRLAGAIADTGIAALAQHAMAFLCDGEWVTKMVIRHRHEHEIGTAVAGRKRLCQSLAVHHVSDCRLTASLIEHLQRRIYADHLDAEMRRQKFGKAPGATTEIDDQRNLVPG